MRRLMEKMNVSVLRRRSSNGRSAVELQSNRSCTIAKKVLGEMQTLHAGCSKAETKIFALPQSPFPGAQDRQNLISWRWSLPSPTDPV